MIVDKQNLIALFDPSLAKAGKVQWHPSEDSSVDMSQTCATLKRGNGDRIAAYFKVDPKFASRQTDYHDFTIQYLDSGLGSWFIEYISRERSSNGEFSWLATERVELFDTGEKKEVCLRVANAKLTGHMNGADFRLSVVSPDAEQLSLYSLRVAVALEPSDRDIPNSFLHPAQTSPIKLPQNAMPIASIVIPVFNNLDYTIDCLRAISEFTQTNYEVIIINNASSDGTAETLGGIDQLTLINNTKNIGFGRACNQGAAEARGEYVVFLNNDTLPQPGWLSALVACAERNVHSGCIGSRLIFPQTYQIQSAGVRFGKYLLPEDEFQNCSVDDPLVNSDRQVNAICGASILLRKSVFEELGGFDERFLNGLEDVDLCLQLKVKRYQNFICASSDVLHYKSATEGRFELEKDRVNVELFHEKWHPYLSGIIAANDNSVLALGQLPRIFDASFEDFSLQTGSKVGSEIRCITKRDSPGHCVYGPYLRVADNFPALVKVLLAVDSLPADSADLVSIDVYNSVTDSVLANKTLTLDKLKLGDNSPFLTFDAKKLQILEFRVYWHGNCDLVFKGIEILPNLESKKL